MNEWMKQLFTARDQHAAELGSLSTVAKTNKRNLCGYDSCTERVSFESFNIWTASWWHVGWAGNKGVCCFAWFAEQFLFGLWRWPLEVWRELARCKWSTIQWLLTWKKILKRTASANIGHLADCGNESRKTHWSSPDDRLDQRERSCSSNWLVAVLRS